MNTLSELLTVIIPVYNEEKNLPLCLDCIRELEHKVVVDSGSTDRTKEIALEYGCQFMEFKWDGHPPKKRTWAMRNCGVKTPWVMFLDADERMTDSFKKELVEVLPTTKHDKFWCFFNNWFMGRMMRHGDTFRKDYLVRYGRGEFEQIEETKWSRLPIEMHEHIIIKGTAGKIKARLEHHDKRNLSNYYMKHCDYADFEAKRFMAIKDWSKLSGREKIKYTLLRNKIFPFAYFVYCYIIRGGFLDGTAGFYFSLNKMNQFYQLQARVIEIERNYFE